MKSFAIKQKDHLGIEYNIGYTIARSEEEANERAREIDARAYAVEINPDQEMAKVTDDIVQAANERKVSK